MLKKLLTKIGVVGAFVMALFVALQGKIALAAADPSFATVRASSTDFWTDNKGEIIQTFLAFFIPCLVLGILIALLMRGRRMSTAAVGGGGKRRGR